MQKLHITFFLKFTFFKRIINVTRNYGLILLKQLSHLSLCQPNCLILQTDINLRLSIFRLIDYYLLIFFHTLFVSFAKVRFSGQNTKYSLDYFNIVTEGLVPLSPGNVLNRYENIIKESKQFVDDVTRIGITSNISEESMKEVGTIFDDHYKLLLDFRKELSEELRFRIDDFLDREKETAGNFATETQKQLANFNKDLSKVLSHSGFWCTSKVFAWLLGIFGFCLFVTFMTIALLIAGNLQFRVY